MGLELNKKIPNPNPNPNPNQVGLELNKKIQHVAAATAEEVQGLSEQLNRFLTLSIQSGLLVCSSGTAW